MNERMETEIERTLAVLRASMPRKRSKRTEMTALLRVAVSEVKPFEMLLLFLGMLVLGYLFSDKLSTPAVTVFCTAPIPLLLLFHSYVLCRNEALLELEDTFCYSYAEMLAARGTVVSVYAVLLLVCLSATVHMSASVSVLRLLLCGALSTVYLCAALLAAAAGTRNPESVSAAAIVIWLGLCFAVMWLPLNTLLMHTSLLTFAVLLAAGLVLYGISFMNITRRTNNAFDHV